MIVVQIPAGNYSLFLERLRRAGHVKEISEEPTDAARTADESELLEVRVNLIQPE